MGDDTADYTAGETHRDGDDVLDDAARRAQRAEQLERTGEQEERAVERAERRSEEQGADWMFRDETPDTPWGPPGTGHIDADPSEAGH